MPYEMVSPIPVHLTKQQCDEIELEGVYIS